ncbi:mediator complex subunit [Elasticomyces elasticus]|nr:mediator complex subunit [Elasticomyces elasticus]
MPGVLLMEQHGADGSNEIKKARTPGVEVSAPVTLRGEESHHMKQVPQFDGPVEQLPNGVYANGATISTSSRPSPASNGDMSDLVAQPNGQLPPELEHWAGNYIPLGKLVERIAQQCYNDLQDVLSEMAEMDVPQAAAVNGVNGHLTTSVAGDTTQANVAKKMRLLDFAQTQRDRFIKTLVLSDWSRNMDDMSKLIDLKVWTDRQFGAHNEAAHWLGILKLNMGGAKLPNPNLESALELLSSGKTTRVPDLGYLPPAPLRPDKMLQTLQEMNALLSIRINLYEELPPHFRQFNIANGRATFIVHSEFEVDLAIADEDPESPFYFIDIRLAFSPAPQLTDGYLRTQLEGKVNEFLTASGLDGCYGFLHGFVLTHKLNTLRKQAMDMRRSEWSESIYIEPIHRLLIVQYWTSQPGPKSWIELGIASGKSTSQYGASPSHQTSFISTRWFRRGVEVKDEQLSFDFRELAMEKILAQVIARHTSYFLQSTLDSLAHAGRTSKALQTELLSSETVPSEYELNVGLDETDSCITLSVEAFTGNIVICPATPATNRAERFMNNNPKADVAAIISDLVCADVQTRLGNHAQRLGWSPAPKFYAQKDRLQRLVNADIIRLNIFSPQGWTSQWAIAAVINLDGISWWVARMDDTPHGSEIGFAQQLAVSNSGLASDYARFMRRIEKLAVEYLSFCSIKQELIHRRVPYKLGDSWRFAAHDTVQMAIRLSRLMGSSDTSWASDLLALKHQGFDAQRNVVQHVIKGMLVDSKHSDLAGLMTQGLDRDAAFHKAGVFTLLFQTLLGAPLIDQVRHRLFAIDRLRRFVRTAKLKGFACDVVSLARFSVRYAETPVTLSFEVHFDANSRSMTLDLAPEGVNPHKRMRAYLEAMLIGDEDGFALVAHVLVTTLPLLQALTRIEERNTDALGVRIHARSLKRYCLEYHTPLPFCSLDVRLRVRHGQTMWHIEEQQLTSESAGRPDALSTALRQLFCSKAECWFGIRQGIVAEVEGVEDALLKLDETIRGVSVTRAASADVEPDPRDSVQLLSTDGAAHSAASGPEIVVLD